jgi:PAS domain S-box-containing protein
MPRKKTSPAKPRTRVRATMASAFEDRFREYERVVENLEEMIVVIGRDYRYLMANRACLNYRGVKPEQIIGRLASEVVGAEVFQKTFKAKLDKCFQNHVVRFEATHDSPRLGERDLLISYLSISGPNGVERVASVVQGVTERKRANELIRRERDRAQRYLDIADVILLALDLESRITLINRKGCATLGWEEHELLGSDWVETCVPAGIRDQLRSCFSNVLAGDQAYIESVVLTRSGEERMIGWRNSVLRDGEGTAIGTLSSGEDITERK